mmetsp:Transcript_31279/g.58316  ORF Transcript_31279/g.58316 Transcript_31279/m.58316 type:complete len:91 (-) Transcript_31279:640-912(-)
MMSFMTLHTCFLPYLRWKLLSRFYAMFAIKLNVGTLQEAKIPTPRSPKIYMCVMNNVFRTDRILDYKFDLKGSTHGRCVSVRELSRGAPR